MKLPRTYLRISSIACLLAVVALPADAGGIDPGAASMHLESFHQHFSSAMYYYPRHSASPLGITGFEVVASVGYVGDFDENEFADEVLEDDLTLDALVPVSVMARKGIPWNIDLGVSWSRDLDLDFDRWAAEVQWAFIEGGTATPALALRFTVGQGENDEYRLRQTGAEVLISKGFTILTPFAGVGYVYSEGRFDRLIGDRVSFDTTQPIFYVGATLNLLIPKITATMEKGEDLMWVVQIGFGF
jgi:hypothetical protein